MMLTMYGKLCTEVYDLTDLTMTYCVSLQHSPDAARQLSRFGFKITRSSQI
jgi:hypothetical protein